MLSQFSLSLLRLIILSILTTNLRLGVGIYLREVLLDAFAFAFEVLGDVENSRTRADGGIVLLTCGVLVEAWGNVVAVWIIIQHTRIPFRIMLLSIRIAVFAFNRSGKLIVLGRLAAAWTIQARAVRPLARVDRVRARLTTLG